MQFFECATFSLVLQSGRSSRRRWWKHELRRALRYYLVVTALSKNHESILLQNVFSVTMVNACEGSGTVPNLLFTGQRHVRYASRNGHVRELRLDPTIEILRFTSQPVLAYQCHLLISAYQVCCHWYQVQGQDGAEEREIAIPENVDAQRRAYWHES